MARRPILVMGGREWDASVMDLLVVAVLASPLVIGVVVLTVVMARRDRAAGRSTVMRDPAGVSRYSTEDVLRSQSSISRMGVTGGETGPF